MATLIRDDEWLLTPDALFDAAKSAALDREWERAEALGRLALASLFIERMATGGAL